MPVSAAKPEAEADRLEPVSILQSTWRVPLMVVSTLAWLFTLSFVARRPNEFGNLTAKNQAETLDLSRVVFVKAARKDGDARWARQARC